MFRIFWQFDVAIERLSGRSSFHFFQCFVIVKKRQNTDKRAVAIQMLNR